MVMQMLLMAAQAATNGYAQARAERENRRALIRSRQDAFQADERAYQFAAQANELDESQLNLRLEQERIASEEQSVLATNELRENMANQRAIFAARGQLPGVGSARAIESTSIRNYNADEEARKLSFGFLEQQRKADMAIGRISLLGMKYGQATNRLENLKQQKLGSRKARDISNMLGAGKQLLDFFSTKSMGIGPMPTGDNLW